MKNNVGSEVVSLNPLTATGIERMILVIRDKQVLLDRDLATIYGVETKRINEQVKRNIERFPEEFCFQLNLEEASCSSKSQIATLNASGNAILNESSPLFLQTFPSVFWIQKKAWS